jgi:ABC-type bacteriocin/lantibiotic exporter with double-glycine peptidase domain
MSREGRGAAVQLHGSAKIILYFAVVLMVIALLMGVVRSQRSVHTVAAHPYQTSAFSCGPAALMAMAAADGPETAEQLGALLRDEGFAVRPVTSFHDLMAWAERADLRLDCRQVKPNQIGDIPLPAITHSASHHFYVLVGVDHDGVIVVDQGSVELQIPRAEFVREFSGYVLIAAPRG